MSYIINTTADANVAIDFDSNLVQWLQAFINTRRTRLFITWFWSDPSLVLRVLICIRF